jgi:proteasome maturation protein
MEIGIVKAGEWRPAVLGGSHASGGVHRDILEGRDAEIDWEDVFDGQELRNEKDFHAEMEGRFGMGW